MIRSSLRDLVSPPHDPTFERVGYSQISHPGDGSPKPPSVRAAHADVQTPGGGFAIRSRESRETLRVVGRAETSEGRDFKLSMVRIFMIEGALGAGRFTSIDTAEWSGHRIALAGLY